MCLLLGWEKVMSFIVYIRSCRTQLPYPYFQRVGLHHLMDYKWKLAPGLQSGIFTCTAVHVHLCTLSWNRQDKKKKWKWKISKQPPELDEQEQLSGCRFSWSWSELIATFFSNSAPVKPNLDPMTGHRSIMRLPTTTSSRSPTHAHSRHLVPGRSAGRCERLWIGVSLCMFKQLDVKQLTDWD